MDFPRVTESVCRAESLLLVTISTRLEAGNRPMGRKVIIHKVSLQHTAFSLNDVTQSQEEVSNTNTRIIKFLFVIHVQQLTALQKKQNNTIYHHMYLQCSK